MQSPSSEGPVREASWQWDGEADGAAREPVDVVGGGGDGPRLSRRGLLAGAGVLAAGAAVWAFGRSGVDQPAPPPKPQPTALSGPTPLWTYRGPEAMTPERLTGPPTRPVFLSRAGLQVLDPATGEAARLLTVDPPRGNWPSDLEVLGQVVLGPDRVFTTSPGHLDARHLGDPAADWSLPLPDDLQGSVQLSGFDDGTLYGYVWDWSRESSTPNGRLFAVRVADRSVLWHLSIDRNERPFTPVTATGGRLPCLRNLGDGSELVVRDAADGRELWTAPNTGGLSWCVCGPVHLYVPDGADGVRALRPGGEPAWTVSPARGESWRAMALVSDGPRVYLTRDNGLVTGHDAVTGARQWAYRLPFLLDRRSHPLVVGGTLFVPGPAAAGVCAIDTASGTPRWTFLDSGPGKDVWSLAVDANHLYVGHDDVLHALPLT
ncbi:PQQ-binding-like beta-propeller repeat protein [Kitasatospora sp. NPDC088264]|uniref:outer membrane protein assembly factor BamB family protein n=1 Tax=unclassified Kitasatospora TaxID=2633591 RepID=UPI00341C82FF